MLRCSFGCAAPVAQFPLKRAVLSPLIRRTGGMVSAAQDRDFIVDPFMAMDRQMAAMDRDMALFNRQMEAEMSEAISRARALEAAAAREVERSFTRQQALPDAQEAWLAPNVQIRRSEQRGPHSYSYYQSISISSGSNVHVYPAPHAPPTTMSPLLAVAVVLSAAWAVLGALFASRVHLTKYSDKSRWRLALLWPFLLISKDFRQQFWAAVQGQKASTQSQDAPQ